MAFPRGFEPLTYGLEDRCYYPAELREHEITIEQGAFFFIRKSFKVAVNTLFDNDLKIGASSRI